jgi:uncharacterized protein (DUF1919 family)
MKRGNKVRYKKHLQFEGNSDNQNENIISYGNRIGFVDYENKIVFHHIPFNEMTSMNVRHIKWALGRAKNRTKNNTWTTLEG